METEDLNVDIAFQLDEFYLDLQEDGNKIRLLEQKEIEHRPFPGLRPYKTSEFQLFKGRNGQAEELISRLKQNRFLAVIGSSGTGKSSLVRAGLIPQLFGGYLYEAGNKWDIAICRPGNNPIVNLAISLSSIREKSRDKDDILNAFQEIQPVLKNSIYGLLDISKQLNPVKEGVDARNLLIIIDQFEEIFRFSVKDHLREGIESHFINLLLKASSTLAGNVYVIITMRSEFLGDCIKFQGLTESINRGQYLVPQLDRDQIREVIEGPIRLARKTIEPGLVELLINRIDENRLKENLDQLPVLQHALMRTYNEAAETANAVVPADQQSNEFEVTYDDYKAVGGMEGALAQHAKEIFSGLGHQQEKNGLSKDQKIAKIIFQALTDQTAGQKGGRRPLALKEIYRLAELVEAVPEEVDQIIEKFREDNTSFLVPPNTTPLSENLIIDIAHESLMRNWGELDLWIREEVNNGKLYMRLNERRELTKQYKDEFLEGAHLRELKKLGVDYPINEVWAARYHRHLNIPADGTSDAEIYRSNMEFLSECIDRDNKKEEEAKKQQVEAIRQKEKEAVKKTRNRILIGFTLVSCILAALAAYYAVVFSKQKKKMEIQLTINQLQDQEFYRSADLDSLTRLKILSEIFNDSNIKPEKVNYSKYIDTTLLKNFNKVAQVYNTLKTSPIVALRMADTIWRESKENPLINRTLLKIFRENVFAEKNILGVNYDELAKINLSPNGNYFLVTGLDSLYSGSFDKNSRRIKIHTSFARDFSMSSWLAQTLLNSNQILALEGSNIIRLNNGQKTLINAITPALAGIFSTKGDTLITLHSQSLKIWVSNNPGITKYSLIKSIPTRGRFQNIIISPDSRKVILQKFTSAEVLELATAGVLDKTENSTADLGTYVGFTPDSKYIIKLLEGKLLFRDLSSKKEIRVNLLNQSDSLSTTDEIVKAIVSPDLKKILITYRSESVYIAQNENTTLIPNKKDDESPQLSMRRLNDGAFGFTDAVFLDSDFLITTKQYGSLNLWNIENTFNKELSQSFNGVKKQIEYTIQDRLNAGLISFKEIMASTDQVLLESAGKLYASQAINGRLVDSTKAAQAKKIYMRSLAISPYKRDIVLGRLITLNRMLIAQNKTKDLATFKRKLKWTQENIMWIKELIKIMPDEYYESQLPDAYASQAYYLIFVKDYKASLASSKSAIDKQPKVNWYYTNKALATLLSGNFEAAQEIYLEYKDKNQDSRMMKTLFLGDFDDLEKAGVIKGKEPNVLKIKKILQ